MKSAGPARHVAPLSPRARVAIIGAGRVGSAFALALASCGYEITALVARRSTSARRAQRLLAERGYAPPLALRAQDMASIPCSHLFIIATPDDSIFATAQLLNSALSHDLAGCIALHASGALSSETLAPLRASGCSIGSIHPLAAINDAISGADKLKEAFFCLEGEPKAVRTARRIVRDLGAQSFSVASERKALYHAAAVMSAGHVVALFDIALDLLRRCDLQPRMAQKALSSLLLSTAENLCRTSPSRALTGPIARGDLETVRRHIAALNAHASAEALTIYGQLGLHALKLAATSRLDAQTAQAMQQALRRFAK